MSDVVHLTHAALHEYRADDEPSWPLTPKQLGRIVQPRHVVPLLRAFILGQSQNSPSEKELGEASAAEPENPPAPAEPARRPPANGGAASIVLAEDDFA